MRGADFTHFNTLDIYIADDTNGPFFARGELSKVISLWQAGSVQNQWTVTKPCDRHQPQIDGAGVQQPRSELNLNWSKQSNLKETSTSSNWAKEIGQCGTADEFAHPWQTYHP